MAEDGQELVLAAIGALERVRPVAHAFLEFLVGDPQRLFGARALDHLVAQGIVRLGEIPGLAEELDKHADLRSQDLGMDGLGQVIDRADSRIRAGCRAR